MNDDLLRRLLDEDPLAKVEDLTGKHYSDPEVAGLGLLFAMTSNVQKDAALRLAGDTRYSMPLDEYVGIVRAEGFSEALSLPFVGREVLEEFFIFWHPDGVLLSFDTYGGNRVNGGKFYYNWIPSQPGYPLRWTSSGQLHEAPNGTMVWSGDHDCRVALRLHLAGLRQNGTFLCPWFNRPFLWLLHYMDTHEEDYDYEAINASRIGMLSEDIRTAITPAAPASNPATQTEAR